MPKTLAIAGIVVVTLVLTASLVSPRSTDVGRLLDGDTSDHGGAHEAATLDVGRLTQVGESVRVHVSLFDANGGLLLTTDDRRAENLSEAKNASGDSFVVPSGFRPMGFKVTDGGAPTRLSDNVSLLIGSSLLGKPVGATALVPVVERFEGYVRTMALERWQGPFNLTITTGNDLLQNITTTESDGRVRIADLFDAEILERHETTTTYRLLLEDGARLPVRGTALSAEAVLTPDGTQFFLKLHADEGTTFSILKRCTIVKAVLPKGSYRVEGVNETTIDLAWSYTKFPQIMERDLSALIEILEFKGDATPGGVH